MRAAPLLTAVVTLSLAVAPAHAATLLVPGGFPTIQEAVDAAQSGDVIKVAKGTYAPFAVVGKTDLTIKGKRKTIVDGANVAAVVVQVQDAERVTLDRLTIRFAADRGIDIDTSQAITVRRCTVSDAYDALRAHGSGLVVIQKNRFLTIENDAVDFSDDDLAGPAHDSQVRKNRFTDIGHEAIEIEGPNNLVEKNRIATTAGSGISLEDSSVDAVVRKNRITGSGDDGMVLTGTGHLIEKNTIDGAGDEGIAVEASGSTLRANRVKRAADNGIEVGATAVVATGNTFERNQVIGSTRSGFVVADGGNTFRKNRAAQSGVFDLVDTAGPGANVYEKNKFGTEQP
jgi:nitrous oxidase accessory protein NosD